MLLKDEVELLSRVSLFQGMQPSQLKLLAFTSKRLTFEQGDMLFQQNDPGDAAYVVLSGKAEVVIKSHDREVVLATLDQLRVRTRDLIELEVVRVAVGQPVTVTLDALPDTPLEGQVLRIDEQSEDYRGDVTYPVFIELLRSTEGLRWGMTASVEIDAE